jgi:hypothetical protein
MDGGSGAAAQPAEVLTLLAAAERAVEELVAVAEARAWSLSDAESREAVRASDRLLARVESAHLSLVRDLDSRPDAVAGARTGFVARTFLTTALRRGGIQAAATSGPRTPSPPSRTGPPGSTCRCSDGRSPTGWSPAGTSTWRSGPPPCCPARCSG